MHSELEEAMVCQARGVAGEELGARSNPLPVVHRVWHIEHVDEVTWLISTCNCGSSVNQQYFPRTFYTHVANSNSV